MNNVCLIGNLTRDVEVRYIASGAAVADATIAVNDRVKRGGQWVEEVSFIDLTLWGRTAEVAAEYAGKGRRVAVWGKLKQETWADKESGAKRSKLKVIVDGLDLLSSHSEPREREPQPASDEIPF